MPVLGEAITTTRVVRATEIISTSDIEISELTVSGAITSPEAVYGLEARVTLYPGRPIMPDNVGPAALIERNQRVTLVFQSGNLSIKTEARALSRAGAGDTISVMNTDSRKTVLGIVTGDGYVQVYSEK